MPVVINAADIAIFTLIAFVLIAFTIATYRK